MSRLHRHQIQSLQVNLTPLIDMSFLLVVFFVVVAHIGDAAGSRVQLPVVPNGATAPKDATPTIVVNISTAEVAGGADHIEIAGESEPADLGLRGLAAELANRLRADPSATVSIRADRRATYATVGPVLEAAVAAASNAGLPAARIRLIAVRIGDGEPE